MATMLLPSTCMEVINTLVWLTGMSQCQACVRQDLHVACTEQTCQACNDDDLTVSLIGMNFIGYVGSSMQRIIMDII